MWFGPRIHSSRGPVPIFELANGSFSCDGFVAATLPQLCDDLQSFGWRGSNRFVLKRAGDTDREFYLKEILDEERAKRIEQLESEQG
jgi:hypothetical protein